MLVKYFLRQIYRPQLQFLSKRHFVSRWFSQHRYRNLLTFSQLFPFIPVSGGGGGFYYFPQHRKECRRNMRCSYNPQTNENAPLSFLPRERADGEGRGRGRREGSRGVVERRERRVGEPDVLIKRLIFIAWQKREFNAHRRLMRRPIAASRILAGALAEHGAWYPYHIASLQPIRSRGSRLVYARRPSHGRFHFGRQTLVLRWGVGPSMRLGIGIPPRLLATVSVSFSL